MDYRVEPIIIDTNNIERPEVGTTIFNTRKKFYEQICKDSKAVVTIAVSAFNRIEKTRACVDSILKYTMDINYVLVLIDTGSTDESIMEYFQSVEYSNKKIVKLTKDVGGIFGGSVAFEYCSTRYLAVIPNDVIVTENWMTNMLKCIESDEKIGFVTTMASNVSNLQDPQLDFNTIDEMQVQAAKFNVSDKRKWHERLRVVPAVFMLKSEILDCVGKYDVGFYHDFIEDDYSRRVRQAGYKIVLCKDVFLHHNHEVFKLEGKDPIEFQKSLDAGRNNYLEKFYDLDAWDDINNYEVELIGLLSKPQTIKEIPNILGIDVRCGTPILEIKNFLRENDILETDSSAYTTHAKYYTDLQFVTNGKTVCDRIEFLTDYYISQSFDYVILGEAINFYKEPIRILQKLLYLVKSNGSVLFKLQNVADVVLFLNILGHRNNNNQELPVYLSLEDMCNCIKLIGVQDLKILPVYHSVDSELENTLKQEILNIDICENKDEVINRMKIKEFLFYIQR